MAYVNTVLGKISLEEMGITAMHEHIWWGVAGWQYAPEPWWDLPKLFEGMNNNLADFRLLGGNTFVDVGGMGLGRDLDLYVSLSKSSKVHIVACTGFWGEAGILGYFHDKDIDYFEELFVRELTQGIEKTSIKAGIIKVGNSDFAVTPLEEITYRAAARAAKRTGAAVTTHGTRMARKQVEVLLEEGLDPGRIIIGHLDAAYALDIDRDKEFCRKGIWVAYDHIGTEEWSPMRYAMSDNKRVEIVKTIIDAGFLKNIILSNDTHLWARGLRGPYHSVGHLLRYFVPKLRQAGIKEEDIHTMLVENPKRALPIQMAEKLYVK